MKCKKGYKIKDGKCKKNKNIVATFFSSKSDYGWIFWVLGILILAGVFWYGGTHDWFKGIYSQSYNVVSGDINNFLQGTASGDCTLDITPNSIYEGDRVTGTLHDGANALCYILASDGTTWRLVGQVTTDANGNAIDTRNIDVVGNFVFRAICDKNNNQQMDNQDCLSNSESLIVLDRPDDSTTCTDPDGNDKYTPSTTTYNGSSYMDRCIYTDYDLLEYTCLNGILVENHLFCDPGQECIQTRSGGYCQRAPTWNPGDQVWSGTGSSGITGGSLPVTEIDLSDKGFTSDGTCRLGVKFSTDWHYSPSETACQNILTGGFERVQWDIYDSLGKEYYRIDDFPQSKFVDLHPELFIWDWDGQTPWRVTVTELNHVEGCSELYTWAMEIYIYDC